MQAHLSVLLNSCWKGGWASGTTAFQSVNLEESSSVIDRVQKWNTANTSVNTLAFSASTLFSVLLPSAAYWSLQLSEVSKCSDLFQVNKRRKWETVTKLPIGQNKEFPTLSITILCNKTDKNHWKFYVSKHGRNRSESQNPCLTVSNVFLLNWNFLNRC